MTRLRTALIIAALILGPCAMAASAQTFLTLHSQPGDYVGQGMNQTFTPADGIFTAQSTFNGGVEFSFRTPTFSQFWSLDFRPPIGQRLVKGEYEGAQRFAFHAPPKPGIDVSGDGRGCNIDTGRFLVSDVAFAEDGSVQRLAIDFEQHCEGAPPALFGSVRFNSSVPAVPRVSVGDATALKGNVGTSDANVTLSLSLPSTSPVKVQYSTADLTALQGTDYIATSGTVQFQPGTTSQVVTIQILGDRLPRGKKAFRVRLSPVGSAHLGDGSADVTILDPNVPLTALAMSSQLGDYIGQGQLLLFTMADGAFSPSVNFDNGVSVVLRALDFWQLDFAGPIHAILTTGNYNNAARFPFQPLGTPGLSVSGAGRGCNTLTGSFTVVDASYGPNGDFGRFGADFEQHCEGAPPALFGSIRIRSILRQLSVSNATIDLTGASAVFTVTLNPPSPNPVSVNFTTVDGSAVAGTDYVATTQTILFGPGELQHTVTVPLLTLTPGKEFFGQISSPSGAATWISQGSAIF
ncbi:MAG: hypothetical protein GZ088_04765 [Acidipila sp.]|nr:hypothetical protein [Acidipila sp.]